MFLSNPVLLGSENEHLIDAGDNTDETEEKCRSSENQNPQITCNMIIFMHYS